MAAFLTRYPLSSKVLAFSCIFRLPENVLLRQNHAPTSTLYPEVTYARFPYIYHLTEAGKGGTPVKHPFRLPRTLKGADGHRYINLPGVTYPDSVLKGTGQPGVSRTNPLRSVPHGYVSSETAAGHLKIAVRSARALLSRHKVHRLFVHEPGKHACVYWNEEELNEVISRRAPAVSEVPAKFCSSAEACCILSVARSSLYRYVQQGLLTEHRVRMTGKTGTRCETFYLRKSVRCLAAKRFESISRTADQRKQNLTTRWLEYQKRNAKTEEP